MLGTKDLKTEYYDWLTEKIKGIESRTHKELVSYLHRVAFGYLMVRDDSRFQDGINLRYTFGDEKGIHQARIATELDVTPCSMLEMMVGLSMRLENIMTDDSYGDRVPFWFWSMVKSLGLLYLVDKLFDENEADEIIDRFLKRQYKPNGAGGLFTSDRKDVDMRKIEIWYQAMIFIQDL